MEGMLLCGMILEELLGCISDMIAIDKIPYKQRRSKGMLVDAFHLQVKFCHCAMKCIRVSATTARASEQ